MHGHMSCMVHTTGLPEARIFSIFFKDNIPWFYPVEMNDIRLLEFRKRGNVRTCIGNVHGKDILLFEAVGFPYDDTLPDEFPYHAPVVV